MLSPRRVAQLGLSAACLALVTSVTVLIAGASDMDSNSNAPLVVSPHAAPPLADSQINGMQTSLASAAEINHR